MIQVYKDPEEKLVLLDHVVKLDLWDLKVSQDNKGFQVSKDLEVK